MNRHPLALTLVVLVAACQGGSSPGTEAPPATGSPAPATTDGSGSPAPTSLPTTAPTFRPLASGPVVTLTVVGSGPVITRGDGPPDHDAVLPGATAVDAEGTIVAFLTWFGPAQGDQVVTVARSVDGRAWTVDPDPIYADLGLGFAPPGPIPQAAVQQSDRSWTLFGWGALPARRTSFFSWRATAPALDGPWGVADGEDRILPPGPRGAWDDETAAVATILPDGDGLAMWCEGQRPGRAVRGGIGYAASTDGMVWTRDPAPVLAPGQCGDAAAIAALEPQVWRRPDGYLMLFSGYAEGETRPTVLAATSPDGRTWSCTGRPLLDASAIPFSEGIHTIQGVTIAGEPALLVESLRDGGSEIWLVSVGIGT
jgi:hypothetical protein